MAETFFDYCKEASTHYEDYLEDFSWWYLGEHPEPTIQLLTNIGMERKDAEDFILRVMDEPMGTQHLADVLNTLPKHSSEHKTVEKFFFNMMYDTPAGSDFYDEYRHLLASEGQDEPEPGFSR